MISMQSKGRFPVTGSGLQYDGDTGWKVNHLKKYFASSSYSWYFIHFTAVEKWIVCNKNMHPPHVHNISHLSSFWLSCCTMKRPKREIGIEMKAKIKDVLKYFSWHATTQNLDKTAICNFELILISNGKELGPWLGLWGLCHQMVCIWLIKIAFHCRLLEMSPKNTFPTFLGVKDVKNDRHTFETSHTGDHGQNWGKLYQGFLSLQWRTKIWKKSSSWSLEPGRGWGWVGGPRGPWRLKRDC